MIFLPGFSALTAFCGFSYIGSRGKARDFPSCLPSRALKKRLQSQRLVLPQEIFFPRSPTHTFSPPPLHATPPPFDSPQGRRGRKRNEGRLRHACCCTRRGESPKVGSAPEGKGEHPSGQATSGESLSLCVCRSSSASGGPLKFSFPLNCPRLKGKQPAGERPMKSCQPSTLEEGEEEPLTSKTQGFSPPKTSVLWWYASMHATLTSTHE